MFCEIDPGFPDGMRVDTEGRLYSTAQDGLHVYSTGGERLGKILTPETAAKAALPTTVAAARRPGNRPIARSHSR